MKAIILILLISLPAYAGMVFTGGGSTTAFTGGAQVALIPSYDGYSVEYQASPEILTGSFSEEVTVDDAVFNRNTGSTWYNKGAIVVAGLTEYTFSNADTNIATVAVDGTVTRLASGLCRVTVVGAEASVPITVDLTTQTTPATADEYTGPAAGSLAAHIIAQVDDRIDSNMTMTANGRIYTAADNALGTTYTRNTNLWYEGTDITCMSPWNSTGLYQRAGTMITARHAIAAEHYRMFVGDTIKFVAMDNTIHTRTILGLATHPDWNGVYPDFRLYTLSEDLPGTIVPCKVMPSEWQDYFSYTTLNRPPFLGTDQQEKAIVFDWNGGASIRIPTDADRLLLYEPLGGGDSGSAGFLVVNDELVLVTVWRSEWYGYIVGDNIADFNSMITTADAQAGVSTGYTVTEADFSEFPTY